jgi:vWA-MoxR associated protein C-terminal domain/vWA-MoxR associated protein middle region (VMAP-M) 1
MRWGRDVSELYRVKCKALEQHRQLLADSKDDYEAAVEQRRSAEPADYPRLERDRDARFQRMEQLAKQYDLLEQELQQLQEQEQIDALPEALQALITLLAPISVRTVRNAYRQSLEGRSREIPQTLAALISQLAELPGEPDEPRPICRFVSTLLQDPAFNSQQRQNLRDWAHAQGLLLVSPKVVENCLMVKVQPRSLNDPALGYLVSAAIVKDSTPHQLDAEVTPISIGIPIPPDPKSAPGYTKADLPQVIDALIAICGADYGIPLTDLTVQWFLPIELMNLPVDHWQIRIGRRGHCHGGRCKAVVVRSFDRNFLSAYRMVSGDWKKYWQRLWACQQSHCIETLNPLDNPEWDKNNKNNMVGWRFKEHETQQQRENCWDDLLGLGLPVALWLRQPEVTQQATMESVMDCSIAKLPTSLTDQRKKALSPVSDQPTADKLKAAPLALLWDNPFRSFPDIDYQSA